MPAAASENLISSYLGLCKLKVVALIVFTAMVGMFLATSPPGMVSMEVLLFGNLGIGLAAAAAAGPAAEEEKSSFDVVLASVGDKKIQVIKAVRELTSLGLKEAKELVDGAPKSIKAGASKEEAEAMKAKLEEQGATVELK